MTRPQHGSAVVEFPSELEILLTREFEAPIALVFDVLTKPEHVIKTIAPCGEEGVTTLTYRLVFRDQAGRDHMGKTDGLEANFDNVDDLLRSLQSDRG